MATKNQWTLDQLEAIVSEGQGGGNAPSRLQSGHAPSYNPPPRERDIRRSIWDFVYSADRWVSRAEIAKALSLKKTNWLTAHIERLVTEGYLVRETTIRANGMTMIWYAVPRGSEGTS